jgi:hypothetical protein
MEVSMLLCDAAAVAEGKLYIHGAGWSILRQPNVPTPMALAIKLSIPWDQTNEPHQITARLLTEGGDEVDLGAGPIMAQGELKVGPPPGLKRGTPIDAPLALTFGPLALDAGGYVWELDIDGTEMSRAPFRVMTD